MVSAQASAREPSAPPAVDPFVRVAREWFRLGAITAQFALLVLVVRKLGIESPSFHRVLMLAFAGFLVHHLLPARLRMPFFALLSAGAALVVLGIDGGVWNLATGATRTALLVGTGSALIGICHLPLAYRLRMALLVAAGAALSYFRIDLAVAPPLGVLWPVLGSMFMFRMMIYAYDLAHAREPAQPSRSFAYFFMLPNICFPLFPIVDYKTFCRSPAADHQRIATYQTGLLWMQRGIIHLALYRFLSDHLSIDPNRVGTGAELVRFLLVNSFLYLRVSGHFHLAVGLLRMFGFALPETNRLYFLAESFTDYWRRVNVYWKDFILKLFYYPAFFRIKHWGQTRALVAATMFSFFATFVLHSYQWFWLRGTFPLQWQDMVFWGVLAVLVTVNSLWEIRHGRQRSLGGKTATWGETAGRALRTGGTFATVSVLWSLWACSSLEEWLGLWRFADGSTVLFGGVAVAAIMLAKVLVEGRVAGAPRRNPQPKAPEVAPPWVPRGAWAFGSVAVLLYAMAMPAVQARLDPRAEPIVAALVGAVPSAAQAGADRGYYEQLMDVDRFNPELFGAYFHAPVSAQVTKMPVLTQPADDFRLAEPVPLIRARVGDVVISTNQFGKRDREYTLAKPPGSFRIALVGSSHAMGFGVSDHEVFEAILEERLNREQPGGAGTRYEVMNFAVNGYSPLAQLVVIDELIPEFAPDAVLVIGHSVDPGWVTDHLVRSLGRTDTIPYPRLRELFEALSLSPRTIPLWARSRLKPYEPELLAWTYGEMVRAAREIDALPLYAFVALPLEVKTDEQIAAIQTAAREAGFVAVDLSDVYGDRRGEDLQLAAWNAHPNVEAHKLIADALYRALVDDPRIAVGARAAAVAGAATGG